MRRVNALGQPIGEDLGEWEPPPSPPAVTLTGRTVTLEPMAWSRHGAGLFEIFSTAPDSLWTYMSFGPFEDAVQLEETIESMVGAAGWLPYTIIVDGEPLGFASYLRAQPSDGVIEIGSIALSPRLQMTTPATESLYLMIRNVFELGYRRCEWKCDALNAASRSAGLRLGFRYEGTFRNATHYKGRNRDTAWFSIIAGEWSPLDAVFRQWLDADNFDETGRQIRRLSALTKSVTHQMAGGSASTGEAVRPDTRRRP